MTTLLQPGAEPDCPVVGAGEADPGGETWVACLHHPLILARVEPMGLKTVRFHVWTPEPVDEDTLNAHLTVMHEFYCLEVEHIQPQKTWDFVQRDDFVPPRFLLLDGPQGVEWSGVLHTQQPVLLSGSTDPDGVEFGLEHGWVLSGHEKGIEAADVARLMREIGDYVARFYKGEDELRGNILDATERMGGAGDEQEQAGISEQWDWIHHCIQSTPDFVQENLARHWNGLWQAMAKGDTEGARAHLREMAADAGDDFIAKTLRHLADEIERETDE